MPGRGVVSAFSGGVPAASSSQQHLLWATPRDFTVTVVTFTVSLLSLFVLLDNTDHAKNTLAPYHLALVTNGLD